MAYGITVLLPVATGKGKYADLMTAKVSSLYLYSQIRCFLICFCFDFFFLQLHFDLKIILLFCLFFFVKLHFL